jgi:hypothetical protein
MIKLIFAFFLFIIASAFNTTALAGSLNWCCPVCSECFQFDPRDSSYRNSFAQQHLSMHQSSSSYTGGSQFSYPSMGGGGNSADALFFSVAMPLMQQIFQSAGQSMAQNIYGPTPEQQQAIIQEQAQIRAQQEAALLEQRRREEEQHQKLMASMKKIPGAQNNNLAFKSISADSRNLEPKGISTDNLVPKGLSVQENNSPLESLRQAAFLMRKASESTSQEESALYADQAFMAADGQKQSFQVPEVGPSSAVTEKDANDYLKLKMQIDNNRQQYLGVSNQLAIKHNQYEAIKKAKEIAQEKVKQQEEKIKVMPNDQTKIQEKTQEESKLAEARKLLEEANKFETKAEKDLQTLQKEADKISSELSQKKEQQEKFLTDIGSRK